MVPLRLSIETACEDVRVNDRSDQDLPLTDGGVAALTPGQLDVLLMVDQHLSSKEIAARLGISQHTVDQRVRQALQKLGVERRTQAARLVAAQRGAYQRLIHQSPHLDAGEPIAQQQGAVGTLIRHADRAGEDSLPGIISEQRPVDRSPPPLPFATRSQPQNEMGVAMRLLWIVVIAIGAAFSAGMYLAGLESLSRLIAK